MLYYEITPFEEVTFEFENSFDLVDFTCIKPDIIAGGEEGSNYLLVSAIGIPDGVKIYSSTGEYGKVKDYKALIKLNDALVYNQLISVRIDTELCKTESCIYTVGKSYAGYYGCVLAENHLPEGTLTGEFICVGIDLYNLEFDGLGNERLGSLIQEDCIYCGGVLPNCEEVP